MKVQLSLLDRKPAIFYPSEVPVGVFQNAKYQLIGHCKIERNLDGRHFGTLLVSVEINPNWYFYYRGLANDAGVFVFSGLDFHEQEMDHSKTTRLNEMILI